MNTASAGFASAAGSFIQRRGGILPGSPAQERCDVCREPLNPTEATEVTLATPAHTVRLYAHGRCDKGLVGRLAALITPIPADPEPLTVAEKVEELVRRPCEARTLPGPRAVECDGEQGA